MANDKLNMPDMPEFFSPTDIVLFYILTARAVIIFIKSKLKRKIY